MILSSVYQKLSLFLGNGIVNAGGAEWKKQRTICEAAFHKNYLKNLVELMSNSAQKMAGSHVVVCQYPLPISHFQDKDSVDVFSMFNLLTLDVVTQSAFNLNFDFLENGNDKFWQEMLEVTELMNEYIMKPFWKYMHPFQYKKLLHSIDYIRSTCYAIVSKRRKELQEDSTNASSRF
jgi:cytochrome P450